MPSVRANGINIHYKERGRGEPLLLIAGLGASGELWAGQAPLFAHDFRVITFDNRGAGHSDKPAEPYSIALFADDTAALMDALGIGSAFVYGQSMGGLVGQEFGVRHSQRARALVLGCTTFGGPNSVSPGPEAAGVLSSFAAAPSRAALDVALKVFFSPRFLGGNRDEAVRWMNSYLERRPPEDAYMKQLAACLAFDFYERLPQVQAPALVINGAEDGLIPAENSRIMAERIPGAELVLFPETGHFYFYELPEESARVVTEFLRRRG